MDCAIDIPMGTGTGVTAAPIDAAGPGAVAIATVRDGGGTGERVSE